MPIIHTLPVGPLQANCYIVHPSNSRSCWVVDPGAQAHRILERLSSLDLTVAAVLLTHGHFDHVGAVRDLAAETGCSVYLHAADLSQPNRMTRGPLYHTHTYDEGTELTLESLTLRVLHTPGHTPGSVCLLCEDAIFSGDTLFAGACGRTDFPGGSISDMRASLGRLAALEGQWQVFPGHGEATTLATERLYNPYL